jgi:hypothetical protein
MLRKGAGLLNRELKHILKQSFIKAPRFYKSQELSMPIIDIDKFTHKKEGWEKECALIAECLHDTGILVVKDSVKYN